MDDFLRMIEEGNAVDILSNDDLIRKFNKLLKYQLITIRDEEVSLTKKGKEARKLGVDHVIAREKNKNEMAGEKKS